MGKPAARMGDMTMHGGSIVLGFPTVLIGGMPAARLGDMHVCPMLTPGVPPIPHVGGPISLGSTGVLIGGMPAARMGDMAVCVGPPDTIAMGCMTVLIGETMAGGGGGGGAGAPAVAAAKASAVLACSDNKESTAKEEHWLEFNFVDKAGNPVSGLNYKLNDTESKDSESVLKMDGKIKRDSIKQGQAKVQLFNISNAKWSKDKADVGEKVKLTANVEGYEDGTNATIEIYKRDIKVTDAIIEIIETKVKNKKVEGEWQYQYTGQNKMTTNNQLKGYSSPEYYFDVVIGKTKTRSGLLGYKDWIEVVLKDEEGDPISDQKYILYLPDGKIVNGQLDSNGHMKEENISSGSVKIKFPDLPNSYEEQNE